jgi:signal transduction histidine kinase
VVAIVSDLPPFSWKYTETVVVDSPNVTMGGKKIRIPKPPVPPHIHIEKGMGDDGKNKGVDISIGENGIHIRSARDPASAPVAQAAASAASDAASAATAKSEFEFSANDQGVHIVLPADAKSEDVKQAVEEARQAIVDAMEEARQAEADAAAEAAAATAAAEEGGTRVRTHTVSYGDSLPPFAFVLILLSALLKATYKGRLQAEVKAAQATETAEAESLKRQVMEARMAAMQAQVEPHFLFNTLASIDHLIETDPPRASQMQKNLIALLRASMPTMRDTGDNAVRDLGRELAVVRPYVEILKVRMEERLDASIDVPDGLLSAEFPAMMIQTLVENAIRHGLEPKAEGGKLLVRAEIVHGKLAVTVADTGVGFGNAATAGTGVGLANIRERLQLLHGRQATLTVTANQPSGTVVCITVPYRSVGTGHEAEPFTGESA